MMRPFVLRIALSACLLAAAAAQAADDYVTALNADNIRRFVEKTRAMSVGSNGDLAREDLISYFENHLAAKGEFKSKTRFELPGFPVQEGEMKYTKDDFIAHILEGNGVLEDYSVNIEVRKMDIARSGKAATLEMTITETGKLPWPDENGNTELVPVEGVSECAQKLVVSITSYIQLASADCTTRIGFAPFAGKPLGEGF